VKVDNVKTLWGFVFQFHKTMVSTLKKFLKNSKKELMHLFKSRLMIRTVPLVNMKEGGKSYKFLIQWTKQPIGALVSFAFLWPP
jgi:hypothetical protein